jgi:hypothetical protein
VSKRILLIPDRFTDYRVWADIPTRIGSRAEVIHFDQHREIPWAAAATGEFVDTARGLAGGGPFHVVAAAGQADRFALALAEAGLARGLVLFHPPIPADIPAGLGPDWSDPEVRQLIDEAAESMAPLSEVIDDPDPAPKRDAFLAAIRDQGRDLEPAVLELAMSMHGDHADEMFAWLQASSAAGEEEEGDAQEQPAGGQAWPDYLASVTVPVILAMPPRGMALGEAGAGRARDAEVVALRPGGGLVPAEDRARAAEIILRMLDRVS